ncbi:hypothetical protein K6U06_17065 [Acidiferrimicrobium sp. IK]|uniref:hypothetical protein n=1 Tax=Acidiferrimicrobium sp. IK TaxID=2871700 RepID=UPI0021CB6B9F|nr:hypothetical protein [Acidiferrimicrobium sp. IK]MCU4186083.1 hypothetical protein [Acidiferrimicrobium sp. IK]
MISRQAGRQAAAPDRAAQITPPTESREGMMATSSFVDALKSAWRIAGPQRPQKPTELASVLASADTRERAELMDIISRQDAWDDVEGLVH